MNIEFDIYQSLNNLGHMGFAYLLAFPIGVNREKNTRTAGHRTFPLVCVASCGFMLIGVTNYQNPEAISRIISGIITGIGFIGGGAILKNSDRVQGTSTAASLWCVGAIGIAIAVKKYEIGILLSIINYLTFYFKPKNKNEKN